MIQIAGNNTIYCLLLVRKFSQFTLMRNFVVALGVGLLIMHACLIYYNFYFLLNLLAVTWHYDLRG